MLLHRLITLQVANVIAFAGHFPSIDSSLLAEPGDEAAGSIRTTTSIYGLLNQVAIFASVITKKLEHTNGYEAVQVSLQKKGYVHLHLYLPDPTCAT